MKLDPFKLVDLSEGILQGVANTIVPRNSVYLGVNLVFDKKIGYALVRDGSEKIGDALTGSCNGVFNFLKTDGTSKLLSAFGTNIYSLETATWTSRTTIANSSVRFMTFADTVLALDGTNKKTSANGTAWVTTGGNLDVGNMPLGKYAINFMDRVYISGVSGNLDRLSFSSLYGVPDDGSISWTDDTAGYLDVDPEDGAGGIVGLGKVPGYMLIFKKRSLHRWDGKSLYPESLINIGTQSQESFTLARETIFFWNERGVYETNGGYPRKVSGRIQDIIDAVSSSHDVSAWSDSDKVYFTIGDIEIDGLSLKNCIISFNLETQTWELYSYRNDFTALGTYIDGTEKLVAGDDSGQTWILFSGSDDDGDDIGYHLQFQNLEIGHRSRIKDVAQIVVFSRYLRNGTLYGRSENKDFKTLGNIKENIQIINNDLSGRYLDFRISGTGKSEEELQGIELTELNINLSQEK